MLVSVQTPVGKVRGLVEAGRSEWSRGRPAGPQGGARVPRDWGGSGKGWGEVRKAPQYALVVLMPEHPDEGPPPTAPLVGPRREGVECGALLPERQRQGGTGKGCGAQGCSSLRALAFPPGPGQG